MGVGIIGGGFTGCVAATHLLGHLPAGSTVTLFDQTGLFDRGLAYSTGTRTIYSTCGLPVAFGNAGSVGYVVPAGQDPRRILRSATVDAGTTTDSPAVPPVPAKPHRSVSEPTGPTQNPSLVPRPHDPKSADFRQFHGRGTTRTSANQRGEAQTPSVGGPPGDDATAWRAWMEDRVQDRMRLGWRRKAPVPGLG
jgi:hypothetical protein